SATFAGGTVTFAGARLAGGAISLDGARFTGGVVDLSRLDGDRPSGLWRADVPVPAGLRLPDARTEGQ
ncbi:MAG: pentapeptide repeat-containing protein, partial [Saccharothrix sp.]|nr:pentapeptide repeat-containing protein [Saccharothrix sp.]